MLRKRGTGFGGELPTTFNAPSKVPDGSGKSIKMESPLAKAIRSADGFIKGTYIWLFVSVFFIWGGWTWIRRSSASIILDCTTAECTLTIQTPYSFLPKNSNTGVPIKMTSRKKRRTKIELKREQVVRSDNIKWNPETQEIIENYGLNSPTYASNRKKQEKEEDEEDENPFYPNKKNNKYKKYKKPKNPSYNRNGGPDADGNYDSYALVLRDPLPPSYESEEDEDPNESPSKRMQRRMEAQHQFMAHDPNSLSSLLAPFTIAEKGSNGESMEYILHLREFNIGQTRRLARTAVAKINAYAKGRRSNCLIRESRPVAWQGLVFLILGIFSFVLCLLLGQFWEEYDPTKVGSYRKRMAEIRKREEAKKLRQRKMVGRKPPLKRPGGAQPSLRRPDGSRSSSSGRSSETKKPAAGSTMRARPNAGAKKANGGMGMGAAEAMAHAGTKKGY
mmetsp:Transcript_18388/g.31588  ORF Transcript_18388/g.31588 Transcript_18388/m.31588 type:complete len:447 (-) Transcript_18388:245-1585(-)